jgi:hypothetical protein
VKAWPEVLKAWLGELKAWPEVLKAWVGELKAEQGEAHYNSMELDVAMQLGEVLGLEWGEAIEWAGAEMDEAVDWRWRHQVPEPESQVCLWLGAQPHAGQPKDRVD